MTGLLRQPLSLDFSSRRSRIAWPNLQPENGRQIAKLQALKGLDLLLRKQCMEIDRASDAKVLFLIHRARKRMGISHQDESNLSPSIVYIQTQYLVASCKSPHANVYEQDSRHQATER